MITAPTPGEAPPETLRSPAQTEEEEGAAATEGAAPVMETGAAGAEERENAKLAGSAEAVLAWYRRVLPTSAKAGGEERKTGPRNDWAE